MGTNQALDERMPFGESTPFILIARCHVKQDCLAAYLEAAEVADKAVKESEPGMLHHTFDQVAHVRTHSSLTSDIAAQSPEPSRAGPDRPARLHVVRGV